MEEFMNSNIFMALSGLLGALAGVAGWIVMSRTLKEKKTSVAGLLLVFVFGMASFLSFSPYLPLGFVLGFSSAASARLMNRPKVKDGVRNVVSRLRPSVLKKLLAASVIAVAVLGFGVYWFSYSPQAIRRWCDRNFDDNYHISQEYYSKCLKNNL